MKRTSRYICLLAALSLAIPATPLQGTNTPGNTPGKQNSLWYDICVSAGIVGFVGSVFYWLGYRHGRQAQQKIDRPLFAQKDTALQNHKTAFTHQTTVLQAQKAINQQQAHTIQAQQQEIRHLHNVALQVWQQIHSLETRLKRI